MIMPSKPTVGFIGLGIMGRPMAHDLVAAGAAGGGSPAGVAARAAIVVTCLSDTAAVREVIAGAGGVLEGSAAGTIVVDMSTIAPTAARELAEQAERRGVALLDAPV